VVAAANSLIGNVADDQVSLRGFIELTDDFYLMFSPNWDNGVLANAGAVTLLRGDGPVAATINRDNNIIGTVANAGFSIVVGFNGTSATVAVGQPASNVVTLLNAVIFRDGFG